MKELLLAFLGSLFPAILYNVKKEKLIWVGISGALGWIVFSWMNVRTGQVVLSTFAGAVVVGLYSESLARILKTPAIVFSVLGIFPLVPGIGAYSTAQYIVNNNISHAASKGIETLASAGAIALGIMFMSAFFKVIIQIKKRIVKEI